MNKLTLFIKKRPGGFIFKKTQHLVLSSIYLSYVSREWATTHMFRIRMTKRFGDGF